MGHRDSTKRKYLYLYSLHGLTYVSTYGIVPTNRRTGVPGTLQGTHAYAPVRYVGRQCLRAEYGTLLTARAYGPPPAGDGNSSLHYVPEGFPSRARAWLHYRHNAARLHRAKPRGRPSASGRVPSREVIRRMPPQGYSLFFFLALARERKEERLERERERTSSFFFFLL